jgi:hypothetical protein
MKIPNAELAIVDPRKIIDYCLSPTHDDGKHKARLFSELLGVEAEHAGLLITRLREAAAEGDATLGTNDRYGQRYWIDFDMSGLAGSVTIRSAWIIRTGEAVPRLVACFII